jgi:hypothetical protein
MENLKVMEYIFLIMDRDILESLKKETGMAWVRHIHKLACIVVSLKMVKRMDTAITFIQIKMFI